MSVAGGYALRGVTRTDAGRSRLKQVSLHFPCGQMHAVIGPNGGGKSTLLAVLAGTLRPQGGTVQLHGRDLQDWSRRALACTRAVLPQAVPAQLPFSVAEVVALGRHPHPAEAAQVRHQRVQHCLDRVGLLALISQPYNRLSGGQKARVQMARCLAQIMGTPGPGMVLLDEPTASLDPRWQHDLLRQARALAEDGHGVVCVLHDLNLAARYADTVTLLHQGQVQAAGGPDQVWSSPALEASYGLPFQQGEVGGHRYIMAGD
ncbi:MAG: heme ABC transporter ATP-binding protein [Oceanococcaceae bacterium]